MVFVSDRGSNVIKALEAEQRLNCASHILNTVLTHTFKRKNLVAAGLEEIDDQFSYCKELVAYFKRSSLMAKLDTSLQQFVPTRWNSHLQMLCSIDKNYSKIMQVSVPLRTNYFLIKIKFFCTSQVLSPEEGYRAGAVKIDMVKELIKFLTPFKEATDILEASARPTLHRVIPQWRNLSIHLAANTGDLAYIGSLKKLAETYFYKKFELSRLHQVALFLNPKMRSLKALVEDDDREQTLTDVRNLVNNVYYAPPDQLTETDHDAYPASQAKRRKTQVMGEQMWEDDVDELPQPAAYNEIDTYRNLPITSDDNFDLLAWWKTHKAQLPRLAQVAKHILAIPASSAASERNFSAAGLTVDKLRSMINPKNVDDLLFLRSNMDLVPLK